MGVSVNAYMGTVRPRGGNERVGSDGGECIYILGVGRRVLFSKMPKMSSVQTGFMRFLLEFFRRGCLLYGPRVGGSSSP